MAFSSVAIDLISPPNPVANISVITSELVRTKIQLNDGSSKPIDRIILYTNGTVDFTSCFNWNTKQLFVMFVAEYQTSTYKRNEITVMDAIITDKKDAILSINEPSAKYPLDDVALGQIVGNPTVVLKVKYHAMTYSGWSPIREVPNGGMAVVPIPKQYRQGTIIGGGKGN
eukprot:GILI01027517.1.p1 GENE.GILI01027517.1~~GILI01027517.1.p1  ORF type:complete len:197 (-),score=38.47 GILI01027517.1:96-608(-)